LIDPATAPYLRLSESDGTELVLHGLKITSQKKVGGVWKTDFRVTLDAHVQITVGVNPDNSLKIQFVEAPIVDIKKVVLGNGITIGNEFVETFVVNAIPGVMEDMASSLNGITLPSFQGFSFQPDSFHSLGTNHTHAGMSGSLTETP
jgi:hypothetical protein